MVAAWEKSSRRRHQAHYNLWAWLTMSATPRGTMLAYQHTVALQPVLWHYNGVGTEAWAIWAIEYHFRAAVRCNQTWPSLHTFILPPMVR